MRGPKEMNVEAEEPDAEVELTAEDLRELSETGDNDEQDCGVPKSSAVSQADAVAPQMRVARATDLRPPFSRLSVSLASIFGALGALYLLVPLTNQGAQPVAESFVAQASPAEWRQSESNTKGEPVRFSNPFDAHEVFEFAAGTSEDEARDAVAKLLMDRAMERQR